MPAKNCPDRCLSCLANVPCPSLMVWVMVVMTVGACTGSLIVAAIRTRELLNSKDLFVEAETVCIAVLFGMLFFSTLFLMVSITSSGTTSQHLYNTPRKNTCARVLNVIILVMMAIFNFLWIICCTLLVIPVMFLVMIHFVRKDPQIYCLHLKHYALKGFIDSGICGDKFDRFYEHSQSTLLCYTVAYISAILVALSMSLFMICAASNYVYLKEKRFSSYSVYATNGTGASASASKESVSVVDTRM